ncbi:MAG: hypothetical protein HKO70_14190 [Acidimicrobiia bacterium]|nr:hypothetical protein [Acidimicrobiia bacterium]
MSRVTLFAISAAVSVALMAAALILTKPALTSDVTASYEVRGDGIVLLEGDPEPWHDAAWERWVELVPASDRWRVARFEAIDGSSDGQVEPVSESLQVWILRISDLEGDVLDVALIHELGHLISLGPDQILPGTDPTVESECITYFSIEGCAIPGGVFDRFVTEFWDTTAGWESGDAATGQRYLADTDAFVTRYAASNPGEDLAETFVFFVYRLKPEGDSIAEQKIRLLWEFPDLVELRSALRRNLTG